MPIETASFFLPSTVAMASSVLSALDTHGLLDGRVSADLERLNGEHGPLVDVLRAGDAGRAGEAGPAQVADALAATTSGGTSRMLFLYFRLVAPASLKDAWRKELLARTGALEPDPGEFWVTHPFECWLAIDLSDVGGARLAASLSTETLRPHLSLPAPAMMVDRAGARMTFAGGVDVRTQPGNGAYLFFALEKSGVVGGSKGPVVVRILD